MIWILAVALTVVVPFLFLGIPSGHDFEFHMNSWMEVVSQWKQGIAYPRWAALAHYGYGEARFLFYPPGSWILGAVLGVLLPWAVVPAAYIVVVLTLCGCSMFLLARRWLPQRDAIFAACFYAANPYHLLIVYWRSAYAELLASAFLPLLLLYTWDAAEIGYAALIPLSLVVAAAWLTNAPAAVMVNYSLILIAVTVSVQRRNIRVLATAMAAVLIGAALSGFYLFPAAYEQKWVNISEVLAPGVRPQDNFLFTTINDPDHNRFNFLVSSVAALEVGILSVMSIFSRKKFRDADRRWWTLALWGSAAALLMFPFTSLGWEHLPKLRFVQLPWRWLLCLNVCITLMLTIAWRKWAARAAVCVLMLGALIYAGHRIQPPWWDTRDDVAKMMNEQKTGKGYEGTDEYVPYGADPYEINPAARKATYESSGQAFIHSYRWDAEAKLLTAEVTAPGKLVLKLFNYPAWHVEVNSVPVTTETKDVTGQMMIPLEPGRNVIQITLARTWDRRAGFIASLLMALLIGLGWWKQIGATTSKS